MSLSTDLLKDQLKRDEGFVPHAYEDHLGYLTLGYGFLVDKRKGGQIPQEVAEFWMDWLLDRIAADLARRAPWLADQPEPVVRAIHNMAYQMGVTGVLKFRNMIAALQDGDREKAALEALDSLWARQTPERAQRIAALIRGSE